MNISKKQSWVLMHLALIVTSLISLFTGMRIATISREWLLVMSPILPQGKMHTIHIISGVIFTASLIGLLLYKYLCRTQSNKKFWRYHQLVQWTGIIALSLAAISGLMKYFGVNNHLLYELHFYAAFTFIFYLFLHVIIYYIQRGVKPLTPYLFSLKKVTRTCSLVLIVCAISLSALLVTIKSNAVIPLKVSRIPIETIISINGIPDEEIWASVKNITIPSYGGANFDNGKTNINVKALHNGIETFFLISWSDPTESLEHLPLIKSPQGWSVKQNGFHKFDEQTYYEDKLAIMLSKQCDLGASGTAHLGGKPLKNKPANWHGKGYHYSEHQRHHDLWHWKAVRTNKMVLADDNYIGPPDKIRPGSRRYTAGYMQDGKDSGAYVMNWLWYNQHRVVPKRIPNYFLNDNNTFSDPNLTKQSVLPWFDSSVSTKVTAEIPIGSTIPSVLYRSNRFEGDRADVRAKGVWKNGQWTLELARKNQTSSQYDLPITNGICLWVAAFDQSQIAHTRHTRPLQLEVEL